MKSKADVVVIGGGILGCSVAYHLSVKGVKNISLLEMGREVGEGETAKTAAMLMHQTGYEDISRLAKESFNEYMTYQDLGVDIGFRKTGSILYTTDPAKEDQVRKQLEMQKGLEIETELLKDSAAILEHAPFVNADDIVVGVFCPWDGYINSYDVVRFYKQKSDKAEFALRIKAVETLVSNNQVLGVRTNNGEIETRIVVNAAGIMARLIGKPLGLEIPVTCNKRDIAVVRPRTPIKSFPILEDISSGWYFRPDGNNLLFGRGPTSPVEINDFDFELLQPTNDNQIDEIVTAFVRDRAPKLIDAEIISKWAGNRSITPDGLPILGPVDEVKGFINCCGLSGFGITNAPICGRLIAELIADGKTSIPLDPFRLSRFHQVGP